MNLLNELLELSEAAEFYVIICNAGRGRQTTWPSAAKPGLFTKTEAEKIVKQQNDRKVTIPGGGHHWHAQPLSKALDYIDPSNACYNAVKKMQMPKE